MFCQSIRRSSRSGRRRGVATVEVAICLPVLLFFTLATMDLCSLLFLKETATIAAYEAARQGVGRGRTNASALARAQEFLDDRGVAYSPDAIVIEGPGFDDADTLENVTVNVTLPCDGNLIAPGGMYRGLTVTGRVTMRKEYANVDN